MRAKGGRRRRVRRVLPGTVATASAVIVLSACGSSGGVVSAAPESARVVAALPAAVSAVLTASPTDGSRGVLTDATPTLSVAQGKLTSVLLSDPAGREVPGTVGAGGRGWHATGPLGNGKRYTFEVSGTDDHGHPFRNSSSFATITDDKIVKAWVSPLAGMTVGVGQPIAVEFSHPIVDRAAVERHLLVDTSTPVVGAWHWESDTVVHYRPEAFWPANTKVVLHTDLKGLDVGGGRFGDQDRTIPFTVGRSQITLVDVKSHRMQVFRDGQLIRTVAVSTGKKGSLTRGGTKVVLGLEREKHMTGEGIGIQKDAPDYFDLHVQYAVRITWSGEFLHAAPWQGANHGRANVSHGCVGMSTPQAKWYFDHTIIGDVVKVVNSPRKMELRNGYGDWNLSWTDWLAGSALPHDAPPPDAVAGSDGAGGAVGEPSPGPADIGTDKPDTPATAATATPTPSATPESARSSAAAHR
ncbi:MAG TPA: Ig-like domain-containing protein [Sporichthyaceae bacterium]|jgi:lipoprotein-anchoring transpeptidase ErfK/SrfK|nr:Ig-like domain-containing protein [Sporichthyaceae bacterium]